MINLGTKKWWRPLFQFVFNVFVNNAYQTYRQSHLNPGEHGLDALSLCRDIVDAYYHLSAKTLLSITLFTGNRSLHHPANNLKLTVSIAGLPKARSNGVDYQEGTLVCYCKNSNVGLHAECFELYQCK